MLWWVAFERFSPWKLTVGLPGRRVGWSAGGSILGPEALETGGRLDQRAVDREVLVRQQPQRVGLADHLVEELLRDDVLQQPLRGSC